jgi:LuxR family maltose regulon positive regulatory protein
VTTLATSPPLLETKLRPPARRAGIVPRPELVSRLEEGAGRPLTLVSAPAGWGKTTLVGDWLSERGGPSGWVAIDPSDNDPARFWRYLSEALRRAGAAVDEQTVGALGGAGDTREAGLSALVNALAELDAPTVLALDDYHLVTEPEVHASLGFLVENAPEPLRLVITSRSDPPIGLARLRARGQLAELRAADLRFSEREAGALLNEAIGLALDGGAVTRLRARTEGWAAGLYLAGLSLRGRDDASGFIDDFAGDDRLVVDYLASEVLEGQPEDRRRFLLRTSVLGRLSGPLCDAVVGARGSARVLEELERSNLFLVPLDNRREWYRYHHLFGELLRHELRLAEPDSVDDLHRRAAEWHLADGSVDEAVHHLAAAGEVDRAADLVAASWVRFTSGGWTATIQRWLAMLPEGTVRADPRLCLAEAYIAINLGRPEEAAPWLDAAEEAAARPGAPGDPVETESGLLAGRSLILLLDGLAPSAVEPGRKALAIAPAGDSWFRAVACLAYGIALHGAGRLEEAYLVLEEGVEVGRRVGAWSPALVCQCHLSEAEFRRGDVDAAERRALDALDMAERERHAEYPHAAGAHAALARVLAARGDLAAGRAEADRALQLARRGRAVGEIAWMVLVRAEVALLQGDLGTVRAALEETRASGALECEGNLTEMVAALEAAMGAPPPAAPAADPGDLTERELVVLRLLTGLGSAREIAAELVVSHNTVKTQIRSIYRKLGVATRSEAVARGRERGLLPRSLASGPRGSG